MSEQRLKELAEAARKNPLVLPEGISFDKQSLPNGKWAFVFRHIELGELGRIFLIPHPSGQTQIVSEVSGDEDDPITETRKQVLEPISKMVMDKMTKICGDGEGAPVTYASPKQYQTVKTMVYPCEQCNKPTALLVFAEDADTSGELEDYARVMHSKILEFNVPTWIIGQESENYVDGEDIRKSLTLKIHPTRQKAIFMTPDDIMDQVDSLMASHCN